MPHPTDDPPDRPKFSDGNALAYAVEAILEALDALAFAEHYHGGHGPTLDKPPIEVCPVDTCVKWREADRRWRRFMAGILP